MNWYERMNIAIDYIEDHLTGDIDFEKISPIVCQSIAGFQRTFSIVTDISVFEYIRRRRITLAAFELQEKKAKVLDVALKYGYESPEAFTRAFKDIHGIPPTMARKKGAALKTFPRITFLLTVKGDSAMDYRIENKDAFRVYGIEGIFTTEDGKNLRDIPAFWLECMDSGQCDKLLASTHDPGGRLHAICGYRDMGGSTFPYMIFAYQTKDSETDGFTAVEVPSATWAIFKTGKHTEEQTSDMIQSLTKRVYTDWLPTASYQKVDGYELELYFNTDDGMCYCEAWIRVEPKK